jgi:hypothetical protein
VQITGFHPGYPECPRPEDGERLRHRLAPQYEGSERTGVTGACGSGAVPRALLREFRVIRVGQLDRRVSPHGTLAARLSSILAYLPFWHRGRGH